MQAQRGAGPLGAHIEIVDECPDQGRRAVVRRGLVGAQAFDGHERRLGADGMPGEFLAQIGQGLDGLDPSARHQLGKQFVGGLGLLLDDARQTEDHRRGNAIVAALEFAGEQLQAGGQGRAGIVRDRGGERGGGPPPFGRT